MRRNLQKIILIVSILLFVSMGWIFLIEEVKDNAPATFGQSELIRLHVLANSDNPEDQQLKLKVRDAIIADLAPQLEHLTEPEAARRVVQDNQNRIVDIAKQVLSENGCNYPVDIQFGLFDFPVKSYGNFVLPAGKYEAVRILIGSAEGKNWWCVLFPPLCFIDVTNATAVPAVQGKAAVITEKSPTEIEVKWKIAELWQALKASNIESSN
ncbi:stage II sporulation protein R|uniref:Stage II sporulation protein R n=1 Tax=Dendrosporobacter quercicolus TaxID=146817 RepID=A0A1G9MCJ1_9FIRM|nr:stage II sporulation protein R [Dendrosporobacter quercicolus]NSL46989.1 stage II sporulation protein R [Dendrosporobacter quercicolus DSM 1736]SDL71711.1 stage II sporulation protein R [Dendrosporobacter quercicolus]